ncbi:hypothetical protein Ahy_A02g008952 isoform A [Arachis hypogaea]|uniref:Uncharacterized protein n=1 Tax=Arachis hypogaea TaxID=3818 RepID=A0A445EFV6_ARAHY|nr:hypothetical protein Ahy_A02g008952 isoform A [Arachis hypogaea]
MRKVGVEVVGLGALKLTATGFLREQMQHNNMSFESMYTIRMLKEHVFDAGNDRNHEAPKTAKVKPIQDETLPPMDELKEIFELDRFDNRSVPHQSVASQCAVIVIVIVTVGVATPSSQTQNQLPVARRSFFSHGRTGCMKLLLLHRSPIRRHSFTGHQFVSAPPLLCGLFAVLPFHRRRRSWENKSNYNLVEPQDAW